MAGITLDELTTELKQRGFEGFLVGDLHRYLDWGFRRIARMANWDWEQTIAIVTQKLGDNAIPIASVAGTVDEPGIPLLRDLTKIVDVTSTAFILTPMSEETWASRIGVPDRSTPSEYFFEWANQLYLYPTPDSQRTYYIYYYQYIGDATAGLAALPQDWEEGVLTAAECICHYRARQPEFAQTCEAKLSELVTDMLVEQNMKDPDFQERVDAPWSRVR